jgi:hypothetical protein
MTQILTEVQSLSTALDALGEEFSEQEQAAIGRYLRGAQQILLDYAENT